jgi:membrane associated rhomboid family serine protease
MQSLTLIIILITSTISIAAFQNVQLMARFQFNAYQIKHRNQWYRFITHAFLHADWTHLIVNMLVLFFFGRIVEHYLNMYKGEQMLVLFLSLYLGGIVMAVIVTYLKEKDNPHYNSVGASGAVSALLFSSIVFDPWNKIYLYGIIGLPGIVWALIYAVYSYVMGKKNHDNINHEAHLYGALFGLFFTLLLDTRISEEFFYLLSHPEF